MVAMKVPLPTTEPELRVPSDMLMAIDQKFGACQRPWIVLGIGASDSARDWPDPYWAEFLAELRRRTVGTVFLIGGPDNTARAQHLVAQGAGAPVVNACDLRLGEAAALLHHADLFVGPDSGPMNIAAATGTEAFALSGTRPVLKYSKFIHPIVPDGGPVPDGMRRILPAQMLERIEPYLSRKKVP
jgi:heptosyltransferase-2